MSGRALASFRLCSLCLAGALPLAFGCSRMARFAAGPDGTVDVRRDRVLLTLDLAGSMDARTTRQPLYGIAILVGIAWVDERYSVDAPESVDPLDGLRFHRRRPRARFAR